MHHRLISTLRYVKRAQLIALWHKFGHYRNANVSWLACVIDGIH